MRQNTAYEQRSTVQRWRAADVSACGQAACSTARATRPTMRFMAALSSLTPPVLTSVIQSLPPTFTDEELFAAILNDREAEFALEVGSQATPPNSEPSPVIAARDAIFAALLVPPLNALVKPTVPGEWKRLEDLPRINGRLGPPAPDRGKIESIFRRP